MLQQTQVATVVPYFEHFLRAFPNISTLARASLHDVLRHWEGLDYYRRALDLHRAAQILESHHHGQLPNDPALLGSLPGFGRYTVGAVLSQAFDSRLPILEANSRRVLSRLLPHREASHKGMAERRLWEAAEAMLPQRGAGEFNQALMELGSLICKPRAPRCDACPLARCCHARRRGHIDSSENSRQPVEEVTEVAAVVWRGDKILLVQRPEQGRWADLWEFPHAPVLAGETHPAAAHRILRDRTGITAADKTELITLRHGVTRFRITLTCLEARYRAGSFRSKFYRRGQWVALSRLGGYPVSSPQRRLIETLVERARSRKGECDLAYRNTRGK